MRLGHARMQLAVALRVRISRGSSDHKGAARAVQKTRGLQEPCRANAIDCITVAVMARCVEDAVRIFVSHSTAERSRYYI